MYIHRSAWENKLNALALVFIVYYIRLILYRDAMYFIYRDDYTRECVLQWIRSVPPFTGQCCCNNLVPTSCP